ncbi:MAG: tRNA (cytidine(34)-2'-O)-methyltransferase [Succinivibrio sp.]|nr:tRNA (cytidine(34)-2'-O)-methyltransferase [Succinivibrio sp.]
MINIVLYQPEMPSNAGNIIRLSVNCGARLHFVGPMPFYLDDRRLLRAGLDYRDIANFKVHVNFRQFLESEKPSRLIASSSKATVSLYDFRFADNDFVIFGREKEGLADEVYEVIPEELRLTIPMVPQSRCLNLSNSVAVVAYEAWRQLNFAGAK